MMINVVLGPIRNRAIITRKGDWEMREICPKRNSYFFSDIKQKLL